VVETGGGSQRTRRTTATASENADLDWDRFLTEQDRMLLRAGMRKSAKFGFGLHPALLIVDNVYRHFGFRRLAIKESVQQWPASFGLEGWAAIDRTADLLAVARSNGVPVVYSRNLPNFTTFWGVATMPSQRLSDGPAAERTRMNVIVDEIAPRPDELVIEKPAASPFFGTPLVTYLNSRRVDTVIVCGNSTSGCVRAAVVDARSYRYLVGVVADCCADRTQASHNVSLFDMDQKYADVIDLERAKRYLASPGGFRATDPAVRRDDVG
jgi:maleamate amidohydrolase